MNNGFLRALGLPVIWALTWAIPGGMIEALSNIGVQLSFTSNVDMWPQTLAIPGFIGGIVFAVLITAVGRTRTFENASAGLLIGLGVTAGVAAGGIITGIGWVGGTVTEFAFTAVMGGIATIISALLFRRLGSRRVRAAAATRGE